MSAWGTKFVCTNEMYVHNRPCVPLVRLNDLCLAFFALGTKCSPARLQVASVTHLFAVYAFVLLE